MNLQTKMPTTADEFLRWNEGREGKREFVRGRVVEMMIKYIEVSQRARDCASVLLCSGHASIPGIFGWLSGFRASEHPQGVRFPDALCGSGTSTSTAR